jgi:hypothetical protein
MLLQDKQWQRMLGRKSISGRGAQNFLQERKAALPLSAMPGAAM